MEFHSLVRYHAYQALAICSFSTEKKESYIGLEQFQGEGFPGLEKGSTAQGQEVTIDPKRAGVMRRGLTITESRLLSYGYKVPSQTLLR